jgi:aminoglycoside phosphotransferase (APT) family kinase protein
MPKLSEQTATNSVVSSDLLYVVSGGNSRKISAGNVIAALTQVKTAPAATVGAAGDKKGMIAFDTNYLYICTADYTGSANVWKRVALTTW